MAAAVGTQAKLGIGTSSTVDSPLDFVSESFGIRQQIIDGNGIKGVFSRYLNRTRPGLRDISGNISLQPNAVEWSYIFPWIYGTAASGTTYALSDSQLTRYVTIDRISKVFTYDGVVVDSATFSASQGDPLACSLDLVGLTETVANSGTFPAITTNTASGPFVLSDCVITVAGTTVTVPSITINVANMVDRNRYFNSVSRTSAPKYDRVITCSLPMSYGDYSALYPDLTVTGVRVQAVFTNASQTGLSLDFDMKKVVFGRISPVVEGRSEIMMMLEGQAFHDGTNLELITILDSTP